MIFSIGLSENLKTSSLKNSNQIIDWNMIIGNEQEKIGFKRSFIATRWDKKCSIVIRWSSSEEDCSIHRHRLKFHTYCNNIFLLWYVIGVFGLLEKPQLCLFSLTLQIFFQLIKKKEMNHNNTVKENVVDNFLYETAEHNISVSIKNKNTKLIRIGDNIRSVLFISCSMWSNYHECNQL